MKPRISPNTSSADSPDKATVASFSFRKIVNKVKFPFRQHWVNLSREGERISDLLTLQHSQ